MKIRGAARTDPGRVRRENQDSFGLAMDLGLGFVADGMGGHAGGRRASEEAARVITEAVAAGVAHRPAAPRVLDLRRPAEPHLRQEARDAVAADQVLGDRVDHGQGMAVRALPVVEGAALELLVLAGEVAQRLELREVRHAAGHHRGRVHQVRAGEGRPQHVGEGRADLGVVLQLLEDAVDRRVEAGTAVLPERRR